MPIFATQFDAADMARRLQDWLRRRPGLGGAVVHEVAEATAGAGWSNETYRVSLSPAPGAAPEKLILRLPPEGESLLMEYDIARQYGTMKALEGIPGYPAARVRWFEGDTSVLGRPFYFMDFAEGRTAADKPVYITSGWIHEADDDERRRLWTSTIQTAANLQKVDWRKTGLAAYQWPDRNRSCIEQHLDWWERIYDWGAGFLPDEPVPIVVELRRWLRANMPREETVSFVWGDARFANVIYRDFRPVALLDWEMSCFGDPEIDFTYIHFCHRHLQLIAHGGDIHAPEQGGVPSEDECKAIYESHAGRPLRNYDYYWLFNAFRIYCVRQRIAGLSVKWDTMALDDAMRLRAVPTLEWEVGTRMTRAGRA